MAVIENLYTGDGATVLYSFTFPYIDTTHIKVTLDGVATTAYSLANATTVEFNVAPGNGVAIRIYRDTDVDSIGATFYTGSAIKANDLNGNFNQALFVVQEVESGFADLSDDFLVTQATANAASANATAAVNTANAAVITADAAETAAATAVSTANSAVTTANSAVVTANLADDKADAAIAAISSGINYQKVANVAALLLLTPSVTDGAEVLDSSGVESEPSIIGLPGGFVGDSGIAVQLIYDGADWEYNLYRATDPDGRYLNDVVDSVTTFNITDDAVTTAKIAAGAVGTTELATNSVTNVKMADNSVGTAELINDSVTAAKIAAGAVGASEIADGSVGTAELATDAVTQVKMADNSVGTAELINDSVTTAKIADNNVTTAKILNGNVTTAKIADSAVTAVKIDTGAVGADELATNAVTTVKINNSAVTTDKIDNSAVTTDKINNSAVTDAKIGDNVLTPYVSSINDGPLAGFRNLIINGAMEIAARGASFPALASNTYCLDRWRWANNSSAVCTISQTSDVPSDNLLRASLRVDVTTADTSLASGENVNLSQRLEGYDVRGLVGKTFTLSFWVKATKTGIYCVSFRNDGADRSYVAEYTVNAANTWEFKSITITGGLITAGTWNWTNGTGVSVTFPIMCESTLATTPGAWQTGNFLCTTNQVNGVDSTANDFYLTGVQLEPGPVVTPFERRPYGLELALCQRYYQISKIDLRSYQSAGDIFYVRTGFRSQMRAAPSASFGAASYVNASAGTVLSPTVASVAFQATATATGSAACGALIYLDAEL